MEWVHMVRRSRKVKFQVAVNNMVTYCNPQTTPHEFQSSYNQQSPIPTIAFNIKLYLSLPNPNLSIELTLMFKYVVSLTQKILYVCHSY